MKYSLLAITFLLNSILFANTNMSMEELKALQASLSTAQHISTDFKMIQKRKLRKDPVEREGSAQFAKPNMFYWHIKSNPEAIHYFDGKTFVQYFPENKLAQQIKPTGNLYQTIVNLVDVVMDWNSLLENYDVLNKQWNGKDGIIKLKPKNANLEISQIELTISSQFKFIKMVDIEYRSGNSSTIKFNNLQRVKKNEMAFKFQKPTNVQLEVLQ